MNIQHINLYVKYKKFLWKYQFHYKNKLYAKYLKKKKTKKVVLGVSEILQFRAGKQNECLRLMKINYVCLKAVSEKIVAYIFPKRFIYYVLFDNKGSNH